MCEVLAGCSAGLLILLVFFYFGGITLLELHEKCTVSLYIEFCVYKFIINFTSSCCLN